jgi:hypothetical protein
MAHVIGIKEKLVTNLLVPVAWATISVMGNNLCLLPITAKVTGIKEKPVTNLLVPVTYLLVPVTWVTISVTDIVLMAVTNVKLKNKKRNTPYSFLNKRIRCILYMHTYTKVYLYIHIHSDHYPAAHTLSSLVFSLAPASLEHPPLIPSR